MNGIRPIQVTEKKKGKTVFSYMEKGQKIPCLHCGTECKLTTMGGGDWDTEQYICPVCKRVHECKVIYNPEAKKKCEFIPETIEIVRVW